MDSLLEKMIRVVVLCSQFNNNPYHNDPNERWSHQDHPDGKLILHDIDKTKQF